MSCSTCLYNWYKSCQYPLLHCEQMHASKNGDNLWCGTKATPETKYSSSWKRTTCIACLEVGVKGKNHPEMAAARLKELIEQAIINKEKPL